MVAIPVLKTAENDTNFKKVHPLKSQSFVGITRRLAQYKMSDKAFRLMCFIIGAYGDDGIIFFKRAKLAALIQASTSKLDMAIAELIDIGLITTKNFKGRGLQFFLTDICFKDSHVELVEVPRNQGSRLPETDEPHIKDEKKLKKEKTTTTPQPEPPQKKPPEPPEKPPAKKASKLAVADIRKLLPTELSFRLNNASVKKLVGLDEKHIRYAIDTAMRSKIENKVGLFINLTKGDMPMCEQASKLKPVQLPTDIPDFNDVEKYEAFNIKMKILTCYNRNTTGYGCGTMRGTELPGENCKRFCPYLRKGNFCKII